MNFYTILEKNTQIQLMIVENLYRTQKHWTLEELAKLTNTDKRSVSNHCEHIGYLSNQLVSKKAKGYGFQGTNIDYQKLILKILDDSPIFQLIKELCLQPKINLIEFSKTNAISESLLRRHLTQINHLLEKYQLQIKTSKGFIYIKGTESQIRYLIYLVLWQSYRGVAWPFESINFQQLFSVIESSFQILKQHPNKIKMIEWCFIVAITKLRSDQGNAIDKRTLPDFTDDLWEGFEELTEELGVVYKNFSLSLADNKFLFLWLQTTTSFYLKENRLEKAVKIHLKKETPIKQFQNSFYSYIYSIGFKSSQINSKKKLLNGTILANGMTGYLFPQFSIIKHDISTFIETTYPSFKREIKKISEKFKKHYQNLEWIHFWNLAEIFMIIASPTYFDKEIKVRFESDLPLSIELSYMNRLQEQLSMYLNVLFTNDFLFEPDLVIRTADMPLKMVTYEKSIPCLTINTEMSSEQIHSLSQQIQNVLA